MSPNVTSWMTPDAPPARCLRDQQTVLLGLCQRPQLPLSGLLPHEGQLHVQPRRRFASGRTAGRFDTYPGGD